MHDPEDEPAFEGSLDFKFEEDSSLNLEKVKRLILKEISSYNPSYYDLAAWFKSILIKFITQLIIPNEEE